MSDPHAEIVSLLTLATRLTPDQLPAFRLAAALLLPHIVGDADRVTVMWGYPDLTATIPPAVPGPFAAS